ncbi:diptericin A-like [Uloborus diversus]|uniref:diptericin A-like n=1 Tax=Uloborus diversus TaxID=327109 RepID=UPI0024090793|nr:diptericin A-like [Uloborus diversus]
MHLPIALMLVVFAAAISVSTALPPFSRFKPAFQMPKDLLKPNLQLKGQGGGNSLSDFGGIVNLGGQAKVWESPNQDWQVGVGGNFNQPLGGGNPTWDAMAALQYNFL